MSSNSTRAAGVVLLLTGTLMIGGAVKAEPFGRTLSGWAVATEIDTNDDGQRAGSTTNESSGTFGPAIGNTQAELNPVPSGICYGKPWIIKSQYAAFTSVDRYHNGDLLLTTLDPNPENPSTICLNVFDLTYSGTINVVVLGGTGRFEGATGWAGVTIEGIPLASEGVVGNPGFRLTHSAFSGSIEGEVFLTDE
jgi:hypothetical protein